MNCKVLFTQISKLFMHTGKGLQMYNYLLLYMYDIRTIGNIMSTVKQNSNSNQGDVCAYIQ